MHDLENIPIFETYQALVHGISNGLSVRQNFRQIPGSENISESCSSQQPGGSVVVIIVTNSA